MTHINRNPTIILDVSHNEDGIKATLNALIINPKGKLVVLLGSSNDKDINLHLNLFPENTTISLCAFTNERSRNFEEYQILKRKREFDNLNKINKSYYSFLIFLILILINIYFSFLFDYGIHNKCTYFFLWDMLSL
jgi:folylpolyglutamate synthase/dihydropteroate synthase